MRGLDAWVAAASVLEADDVISAIVGDAIYLAGDRAFEFPSIEGLIVVEDENERFAPVDIQFDIYTEGMVELEAVANRMHGLFHKDTRVEIGGLNMWAEFVPSGGPFGPTTQGYCRKSMDFRFTPIRRRYVRTGS